MKFSVLIAHYNNSFFFKDCFKSLKEQTFRDFEVIIVDDCSKPEELENIKQIIGTDERFKLFVNEENKGVGFTKNRCVKLASGDICGFVDPDDALTHDAIEAMYRFINKRNCVAVYSQFYMCGDDLTIQNIFESSRQIINDDKYFFNIFLSVNHFFAFKRKKYFKTSAINPELSSSVDQDLYLKLYEKGSFKFLAKPLYLYRTHEKGVSQHPEKKKRLYENWHEVLLHTLKRRNIKVLDNISVNEIQNLPKFIFNHRNTLKRKIFRNLMKVEVLSRFNKVFHFLEKIMR